METLDQYLQGRTPKHFNHVPQYFKDGDYITFYFSEDRCYGKRIDDLLTVYYSDATDEMVGCKIKGVALLLATLHRFAVVIEDDAVRLSWLFFSAAARSTAPEKQVYEDLGQRTKGVTLDAAELPLAA